MASSEIEAGHAEIEDVFNEINDLGSIFDNFWSSILNSDSLIKFS